MTAETTALAAPDRAKQRPHVLVIDDDRDLCELLAMRLERHGYQVTIETTARDGLARMGGRHFDALILDLRLGDADGLDVLARVRERSPDVPVVILTAHGTIETAVEAMRGGAYGFLTKPFQDHELLQKLDHAVEKFALSREVANLRRIVGGTSEDKRLVGVSEVICRVRETIARVAPTDATVLIGGESGTGKELAARSLHALSRRARGPFVAVNCGALPPDLLASELFGHVKGAFTGALTDREGLFLAARGGTLFLDEIGEALPAVQVQLLRAIEERRITRVGATTSEEVDVRLIAATNRDLRRAVADGRFREDLFFRLHVVPLRMPPLRERVEDILLLAEITLERVAARYGLTVPRITPSAAEALLEHDWPGNVRELAHVMEAALLLAGTRELERSHLAPFFSPAPPPPPRGGAPGDDAPSGASAGRPGRPAIVWSEELPTLKDARESFERAYLVEVLRRTGGNVTAAARAAGRNRSDFYDLLRRHSVAPADFKEASNGRSDAGPG